MSIQRMTKKLLSLFMVAGLTGSYQRKMAIFKINAAKTYIIGIKKIRFLALAVLFILIALAVFVCGLILVHAALFAYSPWSAQTKWIAALVLGAFEITAAAVMMIFVFKESTWIKFLAIDQVVRTVTKNKSDRWGGSDETKTSQKKFS